MSETGTKDEEIDRLKAQNIELLSDLDAAVFSLNVESAERARLQSLCAQAADTLEALSPALRGRFIYPEGLVTQLREAAK